eukprot:3204786-Pyramimonas_sp.AAC.1
MRYRRTLNGLEIPRHRGKHHASIPRQNQCSSQRRRDVIPVRKTTDSFGSSDQRCRSGGA